MVFVVLYPEVGNFLGYSLTGLASLERADAAAGFDSAELAERAAQWACQWIGYDWQIVPSAD